MSGKQSIKPIFIYILLLLVFIYTVFPIYWTVLTSIKKEHSIFTHSIQYFPIHFTFSNYANAWWSTNFPVFLINSFLVASCTALITIIITSLAGYGLARYQFKGKRTVIFIIISIQMFPIVLVIIPLYRIFNFLHLINTRIGVIFTYTTFMVTFCTLLMRSFFMSFPKEIEEMARIDGCGTLKVLFRITLPVCLPGIIATGIFAFIYGWNELIFATMFLSSEKIQTLPVGLNSMMGQYMVEWGQIAAGTTIGILPTIVLFALIHKHLISGVATGGLKG